MEWSGVFGVALGGVIGIAGTWVERHFRQNEAEEGRKHERAKERRERLENLYAEWLKTINGLAQWMTNAIATGDSGKAMEDFQGQMRDLTVEVELFGSREVFASFKAYNKALGDSMKPALSDMQAAQTKGAGPNPWLVFGAALLERTQKERAALVEAMRAELQVPD